MEDLIYFWTVNMLARSVTMWNRACDTSLARLMSDVNHTKHHRHCCSVEDNFRDCKLGIFHDASSLEICKIPNQLQAERYEHFGPQHFPISSMCKKLTAASHSCAESEIISLDEGLSGRYTSIANVGLCRFPMRRRSLSRPSGKRHSLSHLVDPCCFDVIDHVPINIPSQTLQI